MYLAFPYGLTPVGTTSAANREQHVRELIELTLFTEPGERVGRPDFGCGLRRLVFDSGGGGTARVVAGLVEGALRSAMDALIEVQSVATEVEGPVFTVTVRYIDRATGTPAVAEIERRRW